METAEIPMTQGSSHVEITNKDTIHHFFAINGTIHFEFIPHGHTMNQANCVEILKRLCESMLTETEFWPIDCIFHHDNSPAHKTLSLEQLLAQKSITEM